MRIILGVALLLCFLSCSTDKNSKKEEFSSHIIALRGDVIVEQEKLLDPSSIAINDSLLIVGNYKGSPVVEIYNRKGELIDKIIDRGKGPCDILMIGGIQGDTIDHSFFVYDLFEKKVLKCQTDSGETGKSWETSSVFRSPQLSGDKLFFDKVLVGDKVVICESRSPEGRLLIMDKDGRNYKYHIKYPNKDIVLPKLNEFQNARLYSSAMCVSPGRDKIAMATHNAGLLDLFSIKGKEITPIFSFTEFYPQGIEMIELGGTVNVFHTDNSIKGYNGIDCSEKYVYLLYSGAKTDTQDYFYSNIVRVISWSGTEKFVYHLDKKVRQIAVSKDDKYLYAIGQNLNNEPEIVQFKL